MCNEWNKVFVFKKWVLQSYFVTLIYILSHSFYFVTLILLFHPDFHFVQLLEKWISKIKKVINESCSYMSRVLAAKRIFWYLKIDINKIFWLSWKNAKSRFLQNGTLLVITILARALAPRVAHAIHSLSKVNTFSSLLLATDTACFARAESHTKAGVICPPLALLASGAPWWQIWAPPSGKTQLALLVRITYQHRRHPPTARVAC